MNGKLLLGLALSAVFAVPAVVPAVAAPPDGSPAALKHASKLYIVQMLDAPATAYTGGVAGYKATKPAKGAKIDPLDANVVRYVGYLSGRHDAALKQVGGARKAYSYTYAFNGFAAELSDAQAAALRSLPGVITVSKDEARALDTASTPHFLGLDAPGGLWEQLSGSTSGVAAQGPNSGGAGEGIIVGIIDGGIWPEHPSVADRDPAGKRVYQQIPGWHGRCVPGEAFAASKCNQKLIGARWFDAGWGGDAGVKAELPWEFLSARDYGGHGTHTATTAAGNAGVPATGAAALFGNVSGIAPRARIAAYKVCWQTAAGGACYNSDSVAAIDRAVADGVDVINFSISGTLTNFRDPVEIAFLYAADAGVFVAASAGNSGPASFTVAHPGPWLTTVAAGTHDRSGEGSVTLGNGAVYDGASLATAVSAPLIDSTAAGLAGADPLQLALCYGAVDGAAVLDPAKVAGKIVVCDRGVTARVNKSLAVQQAGGVGMILVNTSSNSLNADIHYVPTVHLQDTDRADVKAYAATAGPTASIPAATIAYAVPAPYTASFSSRGPLRASRDLLKPDLIAPGQDVLAGVAPPGNSGRLFDLYSGTSMSSPHVAGLAALLKQRHPDWSPMMIKSALMTTGYDVLDGPGTHPVVIFRQGAGHVRPNSAADPGLVFDAGFADWLGFLCGTQLPVSYCAAAGVPVLDPANLNVASIAIGELAGVQAITRTVTNVGAREETYTASYAGLPGFTVDLPPAFTLAPGASRAFDVKFTRTTAVLNAYTGGQFTLAGDQGHVVRIPVVLAPVALVAPAEVTGSYPVTFGYDGAFSATARGLVPAAITADTVADDPTDSSCSLTSPNAKRYDVAVPAGTTYARFALFDADANPGSDLDLCVYRGPTQVGYSGSATSTEEVNLLNPAADTYTVVVNGWGVAGATPFALYTWLLDSTAAGNMTVTAPATATTGATGAITLSFSGLTAGTKYLGSVAYAGAPGMPSPTIVRVDQP